MTQIKYDHILVRYGELSTKGKNRKDFINRLQENIRVTLSDFKELKYEKTFDRLYIHLNGADSDIISNRLKEVFGISSFSLTTKVNSNVDEIKRQALEIALNSDAKTFKVVTKRHDKSFEKRSDDINRIVAGEVLRNTELKVDVHEPDLKIYIEIREEYTYIMSKVIRGAGGYPVGSGGKAMLMLSGGIDSPVAAYLTMKRGVKIECIHYASPPYTSANAQKKVIDLARIVSKYQGSIKVHIIPFTDLQLAIYQNADESYAITLMRRMMYRIAEKLAAKNKCLVIANGESIGQVASQTLESMNVINEAIKMPVIRPVCTMDKLEIIDIANKIGTYETSILPFEDCCTIFTPKNPVTKPRLDKVERFEAKFDFDSLIDECIANEEVKYVSITDIEEDIF